MNIDSLAGHNTTHTHTLMLRIQYVTLKPNIHVIISEPGTLPNALRIASTAGLLLQ